jgi:hypothetical protein
MSGKVGTKIEKESGGRRERRREEEEAERSHGGEGGC